MIGEIKKRIQLTELIDQMGLKTGVEIGVDEGRFSEALLVNSKLEKLYSVDAWDIDFDRTMAVFRKWAVRHNKHEAKYETARRRLAAFDERSVVVRKLSWDAVKDFGDGSLDFIYVDASHRFSGVARDLIDWWPKLRMGGLFAGHDYWKSYRCEVMDAVNGFVVEKKQILHLTTDDKDWKGRNKYPPTFWLVKADRTKEQWKPDLAEAKARLLANQRYLARRRIQIVLPYQYIDLT